MKSKFEDIIKWFTVASICAIVLSILDIILIYLVNGQLGKKIITWQEVMFGYALHVMSFLVLVCLLKSRQVFLRISGQLISAVYVSGWLLSWVLFFNIQQFLGIETVRFCFYNSVSLFWHISQTSLVPFILTIACVVFLFYGVFRWSHVCLFWMEERLANLNRRVLICGGYFFLFLWIMGLYSFRFNELKEIKWTAPQTAFFHDIQNHLFSTQNVFKRNNLFFVQNKQLLMDDFKRSNNHVDAKSPVIVIVIESLRSDVLDDNRVMPNLYALKQEALFFPNTFPASDETNYAWPAILSSQYPLRSSQHYYYPSEILYPRVMLYDVLKQYGYKTAIFSAQNETWGGMGNFLRTRDLDVLFDSTSENIGGYMPLADYPFVKWARLSQTAGKLDDAVVIQKAMAWVEEQNTAKFCLVLNMQRSHFPYTWPDQYTPKFVPSDLDFPATFLKYPQDKILVMKNRYYNALSYIDEQIGTLLNSLKEKGLYDKAIIAVVGDHGEAFYEKGVSCHANEMFYEQTRVQLIIKTPFQQVKGERKSFVQTIDVPPTILGLLAIKPHPAFQGDDVLTVTDFDKRPIFMTVNSPCNNEDAVIFNRWKFVKDYTRRRSWLFDLTNDPFEEHDLINQNPKIAVFLEDSILSWHQTQVEYYKDKAMQKHCYPPKVIKFNQDLPL